MGLQAPVIKAHGSSDARAFQHAIRQAKECVEKTVVNEIIRNLPPIEPAAPKES